MGNIWLAVTMMVRMKMVLGHSDDEDYGTNRRQETEQI
jgi:hypothetical protein